MGGGRDDETTNSLDPEVDPSPIRKTRSSLTIPLPANGLRRAFGRMVQSAHISLSLKRGIIVVYHHLSHEHLPMYLAEFHFHFNARSGLGAKDYERAELAAKGIVGTRLTYRRPDSAGQESAA